MHQNNVYNNWKRGQDNLTLFYTLFQLLVVVLVVVLLFVALGLFFFLQLHIVFEFYNYVMSYINKYRF